MAFDWTDDITDEAVRLWRGGHSAAQVAKAIRCPSRSAVIGKLFRLGAARGAPSTPPAIAAKPAKIRATPAPKGPKPPAIAKPATPPATPREQAEILAAAVPLAGLTFGGCRYPVADFDGPGLYLFCDAPAAGEGESWCPDHKARCVSKLQGRVSDLARLGRAGLTPLHRTAGSPDR